MSQPRCTSRRYAMLMKKLYGFSYPQSALALKGICALMESELSEGRKFNLQNFGVMYTEKRKPLGWVKGKTKKPFMIYVRFKPSTKLKQKVKKNIYDRSNQNPTGSLGPAPGQV